MTTAQKTGKDLLIESNPEINRPSDQVEKKIEIITSDGFEGWLESVQSSLVFSAYQFSSLVFVGRNEVGRVAISEGKFARCMGLGVQTSMRTITISTKHELIRLENILPAGMNHEGHDAVFAPNRTWVTGYIDVHDVATMADKSVLFVNTLFSCLATVSEGYNFCPIWQPAFIDKLLPEDRCHLNGMAVDRNQPRFVTAVSAANVAGGWRDNQQDGGVLIDVANNTIVLSGLSMPHSPRWHNGRLWMLESGRGALGYVDLHARRFVPVAFCPGFVRGLALTGNYAIVCLSLPRSDEKDFSHLPLGELLSKRGDEPRAGLMIIDIQSGETVAWLKTEGARELFDVAVLAGVKRPKVIDFNGDEIDRMMLMDQRR